MLYQHFSRKKKHIVYLCTSMTPPKAIAINTRLLVPGKIEGIGRFTIEILKEWVKLWPDCTFYFLFDRQVSNEFIFAKNIVPVVLPPMARHPILYYIWFHIRVKRWLEQHDNMPIFSPEGYLPLGYKGQMFNVIHDLNFEENASHLPLAERYYYKTYFPKYAKTSTHIFTVSEFSKNSIEALYSIHPDKVSVTYNASNLPVIIGDTIANTTEYILYVGSLHPRKNLKTLVAAFELLKAKKEYENLELWIAGMNMWGNEDWQKNLNKKHIKLLGRVKDETLSKLYQSASLFCYPSLFEGFGLPIIEAQSFGCPVVCSNNSSLPEIANDSAILFDANNENELFHALHLVLSDEELRKELVAKGYKNTERFSWKKSANLIAQKIIEHNA